MTAADVPVAALLVLLFVLGMATGAALERAVAR